MGTKQSKQILIVDDDCDTCALLGLMLELVGGFRTSVAYDQATALLLLDAVDPPDLVVVDYLLGPTNGDDFAHEVSDRGIPTFLITAVCAVPATVHTPVVLFKPFDRHLFVGVVDSLIRREEVALPRCRELQSRTCLDSTTSTKSPTVRLP
jgi:DNA-binding NtrC family response regulator